MSDSFVWSEEVLKKRRKRAKAMGLLLGAFALLLVFITVAKIGGNIAKRPPIGITEEMRK
jgi:hypothetical protein